MMLLARNRYLGAVNGAKRIIYHMQEESILNKFPKKRIVLPEAYQKIYKEHYFLNREGKYKTTSLSKQLESWMHKKVAEDVQKGKKSSTTLEIGAGTLNQLQYEPGGAAYDIVEPFKELFENSPRLKTVRHIYHDIGEVDNIKYDRITSVATFEHIMDLPFVVAKAAMLLNENGHLRTAIPNEGTIMWKMGTLVTGYEFKKRTGLDYSTLMQYEHVNTAKDIEQVLKYFFKNVKCAVLGLNKRLAFYRFYDCSNPYIERVERYFSEEQV